MLDKNGNICEFDGYTIPKALPETPEREKQNSIAREEGRKIIEQLRQTIRNE